MNKSELITVVSSKANVSKVVAEQVLEAFQDTVNEAMANGEIVNMQNFLKFEVVETKERTGCNPRTKETITIPAHKKVKITAGKGLKDSIK